MADRRDRSERGDSAGRGRTADYGYDRGGRGANGQGGYGESRRGYGPGGVYGAGETEGGTGRSGSDYGRGDLAGGAPGSGRRAYGDGGYFQDAYDPRKPQGAVARHPWEPSAPRGPHTGRGPKGYRRSDDRVKEEVCERLTHHGHLDATNIRVSVLDGEVTLEGTVSSRQEKRLAEDTVEHLSGVKDIHNHLRIGPPPGGETPQPAPPERP